MPREATITYDQVAAAAEALKAEGLKPTARAIRERLGSVGSMKTILTLQQAWKANQERQREPGQSLPAEVQNAILDYLDSRMSEAKSTLTAELVDLQKELEGLASANDSLAAEIEEQARAMETLATGKANAEGQIVQLTAEVDRLREEIQGERQTAEQARIKLAKSELRLEVMQRLDAELSACRQAYESERQARVAAERAAAVLAAQKTDLESRLAETKAEPGRADPTRTKAQKGRPV